MPEAKHTKGRIPHTRSTPYLQPLEELVDFLAHRMEGRTLDEMNAFEEFGVLLFVLPLKFSTALDQRPLSAV